MWEIGVNPVVESSGVWGGGVEYICCDCGFNGDNCIYVVKILWFSIFRIGRINVRGSGLVHVRTFIFT